jgi:hypothetical protein
MPAEAEESLMDQKAMFPCMKFQNRRRGKLKLSIKTFKILNFLLSRMSLAMEDVKLSNVKKIWYAARRGPFDGQRTDIFKEQAAFEDDLQIEVEENQNFQLPPTPERQGKWNVRRTHPVGSEKEAAEKEVWGKTRAGNRATVIKKKLEAAEKRKKNYEEKIFIISEKLKTKDNKTLQRSLTNTVIQKEKAEKAIEKIREEQIDIQYNHWKK